MGIRAFESSLTGEAREVLCNRKLRVKDLMEWRNAVFAPAEGEVLVTYPLYAVWIAVKKECDKRPVEPPK